MKNLILILILQFLALQGFAASIEYKNSSIFFRAEKSAKTLVFKDKLGERSVAIEKCNLAVVNDFWKKISKTIDSRFKISKIPASKSDSLAWVQVDKNKYYLMEMDPAKLVLNDISQDQIVLMAESKRKCAK